MTTNRKKYVMIFFLTLTTLCYSLPYLSSSFYTQFLEAFSLSNTQAGFLMSMFSLTATPGYLFGGIIADKFSSKKVIMLSQLLTAALGYAMCLIQGYSILLVCYLGFGISTTFLHWSAYLKLVRAQANENEEGKIFGFFETCAAVVGAVTSYGILGLLGHISSFRVVTAIYASILVVVTIIIGLTLEDPKNEQASNEFNVRMVGKALAHPVTWINGFIVMGLFILATGTSYLNPYLCSVFGTSVEFGTALAIANRTVIRIFVVGIGGLLLDRWKTPKFLIVCSLSLAVITVALFLLPQNPSMMVVAAVLAILLICIAIIARPGMYTPIPEAKVPMEITGTAMGITSAVGYSTDLWLYTLCGNWLDAYGNAGYRNILLLYLAGLAVVVICAFLLRRYEKSHNLISSASGSIES